jgi:predicted kinase
VSRIVYISGRPGAGKSSLAFPLAAELGYSLVTKDMVKEALHDALYVPGEGKNDLAWSRRLGAASFALLWTLAARAGDMVIEANFDPHNDEALGQLRGLGRQTVEVHCACHAEPSELGHGHTVKPGRACPLAGPGRAQDATRQRSQSGRPGRHLD